MNQRWHSNIVLHVTVTGPLRETLDNFRRRFVAAMVRYRLKNVDTDLATTKVELQRAPNVTCSSLP